MRLGLRSKIFLLLALLAGLPLVSLSVVWIASVRQSREEEIVEIEKRIAQAASERFRVIIEAITSTMDIVIPDPSRAALTPDEQLAVLQGLLRLHQEFREVSFLDLAGKETSRIDRVAAAAPENLKDRSGTEGVLSALAGERFMGNIVFQRGEPRMEIVAPVRRTDGRIIALLRGEVDLGDFQEVASRRQFSMGDLDTIILFDPKGYVIAHARNPELRGRQLKELAGGESGELSNFGVINFSSSPSFFATASLGEPDWRVISIWPEREAMRTVRQLVIQNSLVLALVLLTILLISSLSSRLLITPILEVTKAAERIGKGDFSARVALRTRDELETLGNTVNKMAADLADLERLRASEARSQEQIERERTLVRFKNEFIATLTHQLRTPITVINWNLEAYGAKRHSKKEPSMLTEVRSAVTKLNAIVGDLVIITDLSDEYIRSNQKRLDFREITQSIVEEFTPVAAAKHLEFNTKFSDVNFEMRGNDRAIEHIVRNIIANAVDYTLRGNVRIQLNGGLKDIQLVVRDTGIGIPREDQPKIFSQFFRAANAIEAKNVGTGLGLYIVRRFAEAHGGSAAFTSAIGKGSVFTVTLPRQAATSAETVSAAAAV